jgi:tight adherence protein C
MNLVLLLSSACLICGGLLLTAAVVTPRRPALTLRLPRVDATRRDVTAVVPLPLLGWLEHARRHYERELRQAGQRRTVTLLLRDRCLLAVAVPVIVLMPYAAATGRLPSVLVLLALAVTGSLAPDLVLHSEVRRRREAIFLDLPDALSVLTLALGAGQSLRQALELAARDCHGPLGEELGRALSIARREQRVTERAALVRVAHEAGEPSFIRFTELLSSKESPYLEFLRGQAKAMRAEQSRWLERAADRAHLAMHLPLVPLLIVLVLLVAYGFLHVLAQAV